MSSALQHSPPLGLPALTGRPAGPSLAGRGRQGRAPAVRRAPPAAGCEPARAAARARCGLALCRRPRGWLAGLAARRAKSVLGCARLRTALCRQAVPPWVAAALSAWSFLIAGWAPVTSRRAIQRASAAVLRYSRRISPVVVLGLRAGRRVSRPTTASRPTTGRRAALSAPPPSAPPLSAPPPSAPPRQVGDPSLRGDSASDRVVIVVIIVRAVVMTHQ